MWNDGLREQQETAAGRPRGNAVLLAGPGTGKTYVLVRRVEWLINIGGVAPRNITALTFTRAAAAEMRERLIARLGDAGRRVRVSTLHSYALRELIRLGAAGLPKPVRIAGDWEERWVVIEELGRMLARTTLQVEDALARLADDWDTLAADGQGWEDGYADAPFLGAWRRHREVYGYTLRSELVYQMLCELRSNPDFSPATPCEVILVDEYQDLNHCDLTTIRTLATRAGAEAYAAGDDDQSIYSFRHAHPAGIRSFQEDFDPAAAPPLSECLRCGPAVVALANWLISQELGRIPKELESVTAWDASVHLVRFQDQDDEAAGVARIIAAATAGGTPPEEVLVLLRSDKNGGVSRALVEALAATHGIGCYLPRSSQADDPSLQVLLEYLVLAEALREENRVDDLALRSLLELEANGIGSTRIRNVVDYCLANQVRFDAALEMFEAQPQLFAGSGLQGLIAARKHILDMATQFAEQPGEDFDGWLTRVCGLVGVIGDALDIVLAVGKQIAAELEANADPALAALAFAQQLAQSMNKLGDTLPPKVLGRVTVTTMHGAKGLSADFVIVLQAEDEVMPDGKAGIDYDESRRLLYVSLTRARKRLVIGACGRRLRNQRFVGQQKVTKRNLTRFLVDYGLVGLTVDDYLAGL